MGLHKNFIGVLGALAFQESSIWKSRPNKSEIRDFRISGPAQIFLAELGFT